MVLAPKVPEILACSRDAPKVSTTSTKFPTAATSDRHSRRNVQHHRINR
jgi:hypothetical protein